MPARAMAIVCCFASLVPCSSHAQQTRPREHFQNADVVYDWVTNSRKDKLRTFVAPVLVIRGSKDTVMSRADSSAIAETVNRVHPGKARYLEMEGMTHGFTVEKKFPGEMVTVILNWAKEQLATGIGSSQLENGRNGQVEKTTTG